MFGSSQRNSRAGDDPASEPSSPLEEAPAPEVFVARQPIFDRRSVVAGYELLFRGSRENRYDGKDADLASATTIERSANAFGLDELVGERTAWVNLTRDALLGEYYRILPPERTVIELLENVHPDAKVLEACRKLRGEGYRLALDDYTFSEEAAPLLEVAHLVKVDFMQTGVSCDARKVGRLKDRGLSLLAEKVETLVEHRAALGAGYDLFQGYYFCKPEILETRDLTPSRLSQLRFLAEVTRGDTSFERLESLFRSDPALTTRLLRYLNSAAFGWRHEIQSLGHALALMGLEPLRKWAMMMGFVALGNERPRELVVTALSRARFAEELAVPSGLPQHGLHLFLTGMLSVVDTMVGRPMREILEGLAVPAPVHAALTGGEHPVGQVFRVVRAYERGDWRTVEQVASSCPLPTLNAAYRRSLTWAETIATS